MQVLGDAEIAAICFAVMAYGDAIEALKDGDFATHCHYVSLINLELKQAFGLSLDEMNAATLAISPG